jgi:hypothetical protein
MNTNSTTLRSLVLAAMWVLTAGAVSAQVSQGGQPLHWDDAAFVADYPGHETADVDLDALAAEDAITDQVKTAAWRFGVEHEVLIAPETHGVWTVEEGLNVWRMGLHCPEALNVKVNFSTYSQFAHLTKNQLMTLYELSA